jgi:type II secretory pathway component PulM
VEPKMIKGMNERERILVIAAGIFIFITVGWLGVLEPTVERRDALVLKIEAKKKEKQAVDALAARFHSAKLRFRRLEMKLKSQGVGFSPLGVMENMAASAGLKENVVSMNPQPQVEIEGYMESLIALKLEKVELSKLVTFLKLIQNSENYLRVKRVSIKPQYENPEWLTVSLSITGYESIK